MAKAKPRLPHQEENPPAEPPVAINTLVDLKGVGPIYAARLIDAGKTDFQSIVASTPTEIAEITGMTKDDAADVCRFARKTLVEQGVLFKEFATATEIYEQRKKLKHLSTGIKKFDELLFGGYESKASYEFFAEFGSGKTQLCHTASVIAQLPEKEGGLNGSVVYIDTEGTFRPERIVEIATERKYAKSDKEAAKFLDRILVARAYNSDHQRTIIAGIPLAIKTWNAIEGNTRIVLVVVDSLTALYRAEMVGRELLAPRQQKINQMYHNLNRDAEVYDFVALVTNQMVASPDMFERDKGAGGNVVAHTSTYRISLRKKLKNCILRMVDSPMHPEVEVTFKLNERGVDDFKEEKK